MLPILLMAYSPSRKVIHTQIYSNFSDVILFLRLFSCLMLRAFGWVNFSFFFSLVASLFKILHLAVHFGSCLPFVFHFTSHLTPQRVKRDGDDWGIMSHGWEGERMWGMESPYKISFQNDLTLVKSNKSDRKWKPVLWLLLRSGAAVEAGPGPGTRLLSCCLGMLPPYDSCCCCWWCWLLAGCCYTTTTLSRARGWSRCENVVLTYSRLVLVSQLIVFACVCNWCVKCAKAGREGSDEGRCSVLAEEPNLRMEFHHVWALPRLMMGAKTLGFLLIDQNGAG